MKLSRSERLEKYGQEGTAFLRVMRPKMDADDVTRPIARALCNYMYRGLLAPEWVQKPLVALRYLKNRCKKSGKYEFRRVDHAQPFGPDNCVIVHIAK